MTVFRDNLASVVEAIYLDEDLSMNPLESDIFVNPSNDSIIDKTVIFNNYIPWDLDIEKLAKSNRIISRFPIECSNYILDPYLNRLPKDRIKVSDRNYSILSGFEFDKINCSYHKDVLTLPQFSLVTNPEVSGYKTVTGLVADSVKIRNTWSNFSRFVRNRMLMYKDPTKLFEEGSVYAKTLKNDTGSFDICTENAYFRGPLLRKRRPDKRMNVKKGYFYGKFKTYRITDKFRSFDINYNTRDGFHLFYCNKSELDIGDVSALLTNGGLDFSLYLLFYFCKKNHFKSITGDILTEPLQFLIDPKGMMNLHVTLFPEGLIDDSETFHISLLGMSKYNI